MAFQVQRQEQKKCLAGTGMFVYSLNILEHRTCPCEQLYAHEAYVVSFVYMSAKLLILTLSLQREAFQILDISCSRKTVEIEGRMIVIEVKQTMLLSEEKRSQKLNKIAIER